MWLIEISHEPGIYWPRKLNSDPFAVYGDKRPEKDLYNDISFTTRDYQGRSHLYSRWTCILNRQL